MPDHPTIKELLSSPRDFILDFLGKIYEKSPWVAMGFFDSYHGNDGACAGIETVRDLAVAMSSVVNSAPQEQKLELLNAHPDLCQKLEKLKNLSKESQDEQSRAGLQSLTDEQQEHFLKMNSDYRSKFGFPFILAVRNATKYTVMHSLEARLENSREIELATALGQVHRIAWMRLLQVINTPEPKGFLTCHVLDTANGIPAANMRIRLTRLTPSEQSDIIGEFKTNSDGRLSNGPALKGIDFIVGTYEWIFYAGDYFAGKASAVVGGTATGTPFLDEVPIRFGIDDPDEHYHVPLLVSPWSFSTYRGS